MFLKKKNQFMAVIHIHLPEGSVLPDPSCMTLIVLYNLREHSQASWHLSRVKSDQIRVEASEREKPVTDHVLPHPVDCDVSEFNLCIVLLICSRYTYLNSNGSRNQMSANG